MFERLIRLVREEKVSLFIGAGFSIEANAPSVRNLCEAILSQIDDGKLREEHINDGLPELSSFFVEKICSGSRNSLIELLGNQFDFTPAKMDDHRALSQIPHFHNIFTTNYDTLLEDSYDKKDCQVIRKDDDCAYIDNAKPVKIFKIHGDFVNQNFVVITTEDYDAFLKNNPNPLLWNLVKQEFLTKHILFIGYSLADDNIISIIKTISETINRNQKEMFLIAPKMNYRQRGRLKKMKVQYIDAVAADFFSELTDELKANIGCDFRHHKVSSETFTRFCHLHDIDPIISLQKGKDNQIVDFKPLKGENLRHAINMTMDLKFKEILENMDFEKNGAFVDNAPIPRVPYIRFRQEDFLKCTHSVNGLVMNDEIASVLIGPSVTDFPMTIRIPSRNFLEKVVGRKYNPKPGKAVIDLDCHIYRMKFTVEAKEETEHGANLSVTFSFTFNDTYTNNNEAIKWIDLIDAFFSKEDVFISEISANPFNASSVIKDSEYKNDLKDFKRYFENIKQIELLSGVNFKIYNGYTDANLDCSTVIVSYLRHEPVIIRNSESFDFSTTAKFASADENRINIGMRIAIVVTGDENSSYSLNDRTFVIPYTHDIFNSCEVIDVTRQDGNYMKMCFHYGANSYVKLFSDKSADEEFPQMTLLEDCKEVQKQES